MEHSKIAIKIGAVDFSGEGEASWLSDQLDKVLKNSPELAKAQGGYHVVPAIPSQPSSAGQLQKSSIPLATFLQNKAATTNQTRKFLATSEWLFSRGLNNLSTGEVSKALKDNHQARLGNPSECLNQNVAKGFCEKSEQGFFITTEGHDSLK